MPVPCRLLQDRRDELDSDHVYGVAEMKWTLPVLFVVLLAGCTTPEQQRQADEDKCRSYGFTHRNDAFAECLQRIELDRRAAIRSSSISRDSWLWAPPPRVIVVDRERKS